MPDHPQFYALGAFLLGVALTAAWKSQILDSVSEHQGSERRARPLQKNVSRFSKINDLAGLKKSLAEIAESLERGGGNIKEGIEGCIGETPLIKIKSLSEATGCEILAKAEVTTDC